jgi:hypothetical protein
MNVSNIYKSLQKKQYFLLYRVHTVKSYTVDKAIWWYARECFLCRLLNKAFRTENLDIIFLLGCNISSARFWFTNKGRARIRSSC